jgi:O-antigen ligase
MKALDTCCNWIGFALVLIVVLASPWLFAAWEMWWFWPFAVAIFTAAALFALRLTLAAWLGGEPLHPSRLGRRALLLYLPFLAYALLRALQADVYMDAERSFLLQLTPAILGALIVFGFTRRQMEALLVLLLVNFLLLGLYGIANHYLTGNARVLWVPGFPGYQEEYHRATGSYFCPDHFAGLMELALACALALLLARNQPGPWKVAAGLLAATAALGIWLSKSRGGGLVTGLLLLVALGWGLSQWPPAVRWWVRGAGVVALTVLVGAVALFGGHYVARFRAYPWENLESVDRYQMASAALRAWKTAPVFGIGPGMHQNLWPHFAASPDGDRAQGIRPKYLNNTYYSYEAHDDWVQLLEEYGIVGLGLFLLALGGVGSVLWTGRRRELRERADVEWAATHRVHYWTVLGAMLAGVAMGLHALVDFNLQMPATVWILAALVAVPVALTAREHRSRRRA